MYLKQIVVACLATALAGGAMAQQLTLQIRLPRDLCGAKGDTLWDISGQYLAEPWLWPRLWNINPQIANPHWIYPGDVLHLSWVNGEPRLGKASQGASIGSSVSPKNRYENKANPIPTLPLSEIAQSLPADRPHSGQQPAEQGPALCARQQ